MNIMPGMNEAQFRGSGTSFKGYARVPTCSTSSCTFALEIANSVPPENRELICVCRKFRKRHARACSVGTIFGGSLRLRKLGVLERE
jgi:hypothetical protein